MLLAAAIAIGGGAQAKESDALDLSALSTKKRVLFAKDAQGNDVPLTLDGELQRAAGRLVAKANPIAAAVVLIDARSGNVLAFVERTPSGGDFGALLLQPSAPSASLFKLVTTTALFEHGRVSPKQRVCTKGGQHRIERRHLERPNSRDSHCGLFFSALGHSRNAVYAQLVTSHLMHQDLSNAVDAFGLRAPVPFDVPARAANVQLPYGDLEFARTAAGFENVELSALGAAQLGAVVMTGGQRMRFFIRRRASSERVLEGRAMKDATAYTLRRMMEVTVHAGTSLDAFSAPTGQSYLANVRVAGKTGTLKPDAKSATTSWFIGFAPSKQPEVLVSVVVQNGAVWRQKANQLARDMLRVWFARRGEPGVSDPFDSER
jgi:cell division protein FtsI/penicillin-binding protein 2